MTEPSVPGGVDSESEIPPDHPRYADLISRYRIEEGIASGITHIQGMHAEGRGSAFDYLLGERTIPSAQEAGRVAAAELLRADHPVISVNGNVAALVPEEIAELARVVDATIEVNLFHRSDERIQKIADHLIAHGADNVVGFDATETIPGLSHDRARVASDGIYAADVVVIPLEDGDRAEALRAMGKREIVIDLNPLCRSIAAAHVPLIDNVLRAIPLMTDQARELQDEDEARYDAIIRRFDPDYHIREAEAAIRSGSLDSL